MRTGMGMKSRSIDRSICEGIVIKAENINYTVHSNLISHYGPDAPVTMP
jgi:hypothetical protein